MRILVDTNVLLRSVDLSSPQHPLARRAIEDRRRQGDTLVVASQNLAEFWAVVTRPVANNGRGYTPQAAHVEVQDLLTLFQRLPDTDAAFDHWLDLVTRYGVSGKPTHDARLVGTMLANGVTHVLTFNGGDFARFTEITVESP